MSLLVILFWNWWFTLIHINSWRKGTRATFDMYTRTPTTFLGSFHKYWNKGDLGNCYLWRPLFWGANIKLTLLVISLVLRCQHKVNTACEVMSLVLRCQHKVNTACEVISLVLHDKNKVNSAREKLKSAKLRAVVLTEPRLQYPESNIW
jgi:hypothetical protein